jgi:hypothetical protein
LLVDSAAILFAFAKKRASLFGLTSAGFSKASFSAFSFFSASSLALILSSSCFVEISLPLRTKSSSFDGDFAVYTGSTAGIG